MNDIKISLSPIEMLIDSIYRFMDEFDIVPSTAHLHHNNVCSMLKDEKYCREFRLRREGGYVFRDIVILGHESDVEYLEDTHRRSMVI